MTTAQSGTEAVPDERAAGQFGARAILARLSPSRSWLRSLLPVSGVVVLLAGGGFAALESDSVSSYWHGVWWALSLMTTVGFIGDAPSTTLGAVLSAALMVLGFMLLAMTTAAVASLFVREDEEPFEKRDVALGEEMLEELRVLNRRITRLEAELIEREEWPRDEAAGNAPFGRG